MIYQLGGKKIQTTLVRMIIMLPTSFSMRHQTVTIVMTLELEIIMM